MAASLLFFCPEARGESSMFAPAATEKKETGKKSSGSKAKKAPAAKSEPVPESALCHPCVGPYDLGLASHREALGLE